MELSSATIEERHCHTRFSEGNQVHTYMHARIKLHESWEGPYIAKETNMPGAFRLMEQTGEELPYSWNADTLKRYYP
jgi:hypothetical protein